MTENSTSVTRIGIDQAFAGVNYIAALAKKTDNLLTNLLDSDTGPQANTQSIFNKFTIFQYAGLNAGFAYQEAGHFIGFYGNTDQGSLSADSANQQSLALTQLQSQTNKQLALGNSSGVSSQNAINNLNASTTKLAGAASNYKASTDPIKSNPVAQILIDWGANHSNSTPQGFQPYSLTDFIFCKYYGKIPNNRLITLRRYPQPIGDSLHNGLDRSKPAIPIAQAVSWFGSDTGNSLNSLGVFAWDMPWKALSINDYQPIDGNEVTLDSLLDILQKSGNSSTNSGTISAIKSVIAAVNKSSAQLAQITQFDAKEIQYMRDLYTKGPYWNRIYGPVNVINASTIRDRGIQLANWQKTFDINFHYSFRSFNRMSPKVVALDLISNFMNLTYNDAQFLGQLVRYFQKPGLKADPVVTEALGSFLTNLATSYTGDSQDFMKLVNGFTDSMDKVGSSITNDLTNTVKRVAQTALASRLSKAVPTLISVKSALSDRPIGEWHITVGNPMNPIFVMGDLIVTDTKMKWDEEMGPDDFPTGIMFTVTLKQGKPRDKTAIERMLNLGENKLTAGILRTSSADDTFGDQNNAQYNAAVVGVSAEAAQQANDAAFNGTKPNTKYTAMVDRFRKGYGIVTKSQDGTWPEATAKNSNGLDDSILALYYQRNLGAA